MFFVGGHPVVIGALRLSVESTWTNAANSFLPGPNAN